MEPHCLSRTVPIRACRVILLDDHPVVLEGPLANLELIAGIEVVGLATTGRGGLELVARQRPDLVILDLVFV